MKPATPDQIVDLPGWIVQHATTSDSAEDLLDGVCSTFVRGDVPLWRVSVAIPTLDPQFRGATLHWRRDSAIELETAPHGAETDEWFQQSPIFALQSKAAKFGRWKLAKGEGCDVHPSLRDLCFEGGTDYAMFLVEFSPGTSITGAAISIATDRTGGFEEADLTSFRRLVPVLGLAIYRLVLFLTAGQMLDSYLGSMSGARVMAGEIVRGQGRIISAAILLADLSGFTRLTDREDPMDVVRWLNEHFEAIGDPVIENNGEILKFLGDGLLAVFPAEASAGEPCAACEAALRVAREAIRRNDNVNARRKDSGEPQLPLDIALHFGEVVYGNVGTSRRLDFTTIGRAVNEVSRIEGLCGQLGVHLLLSDLFARRCRSDFRQLGTFELRGVEFPLVLSTTD
ncbi:adenylate/guanylate cyclase domain-containing protein [Bradyrhizobium sp. PRIMUS42]|uniref:adenylate/guanylate cyclase domain-containing protein n=1 Tax=Bradyrhizobium sp. PRIMUS42 TaxID=2908926 RepID=UPI001FF0FFA2|nr:adenylate/guanylate cyclase domain-containing protein [Bradyrhizobium sp. PRIMUS42]MCJ9729642.1 adenylate/guanylate cyclase domain-containing protein [Bradyrhizobium sp. PRIMUS42]